MMVDGLIKRRIALTSGVPKTINFGAGVHEVSLALAGTGKVAYKLGITKPTSVDDDTSNFLSDEVSSVVIQRSDKSKLTNITMLSNASVTVQWDIDA